MFEIISLLFALALAGLVLAAAVMLRVRRREAFGRRDPRVDDDVIAQIIERGEVYVDEDEPLDLEEIHDEEERFWSESWDEPSGDW